jgi:hypothetical protein
MTFRKVRHPAKYSDALLPIFCEELIESKRVLDPFAGVGKLRLVLTTASVFLNEIEHEWAVQGPADTIADALHLPYADDSFDTICTSPTYGNRLADHHEAKDGSVRNTYRHTLGRILRPENSGQLQWGDNYRKFHRLAWSECTRVLQLGGKLILNISNHIRGGKEMLVSEWHVETLMSMGFSLRRYMEIQTPRNRFGANSSLRVEFERVYVLTYP